MIANAHIKIGSNSYEKVKSFKYLGCLVTNQNSIQEEIKCIHKGGNSYYYSVQQFFFLDLSKNLKIKIYKIIILPVVLYGCETCYLTLREERRLRVFENRIPRRIFETKRDENGEWGRFHNKEPHGLYCSLKVIRAIKSRRIRWVVSMEEDRSAFKNFNSKSKGRRPFRRPRLISENNFRKDLEEGGVNTRIWIYVL